MKKKRVVIYARVSTVDQDLRMQTDELHEYALARKFEIVDTITEQISSGKKNRPGYESVIELARKRKIDAILVWKFDRFARSTRELINSLELFQELNVDFLSLQDNIDTTTAMGKALFTIIAAIGELERATIKERVKSGMKKAQRYGTKSGRPIGREPLPYHIKSNVLRLRAQGKKPVEIYKSLGISRQSYYRVVKAEDVSNSN